DRERHAASLDQHDRAVVAGEVGERAGAIDLREAQAPEPMLRATLGRELHGDAAAVAPGLGREVRRAEMPHDHASNAACAARKRCASRASSAWWRARTRQRPPVIT